MKSIWVTNPAETWPNWTKVRDAGCANIYFPTRKFVPDTGKYIRNDRQMAGSYRAGVQSQDSAVAGQKFEYRLYRDPSWDSIYNPQTLASSAQNDIFTVLQGPGYIPYMFDIEYHSAQFCLDTFKAFRAKFPKGPVSWTLEPFQGGWFTKELINWINNDINFVVIPQDFYYNMTPAGTRNGLNPRQELVAYGISSNRVKTFYDAAKPIPAGWDGAILSAERLP
jgi:hypothetical protein